MESKQIYGFFEEVAQRYKKVPYHHFTHGVWLMKMLYWILTRIEISDFFEPIDLVGMMIAGVAHDLDHGGMNNSFLMRTSDPLSLIFNDHSVWENYHASLLFQLMQNHPEIFVNLSEA